MDLARGGRYARLPPAAVPAARGRRVDRQLGRRRTDRGAARVRIRPRTPASADGLGPRGALSVARAPADPGVWPALRRLGREPPRAGAVRAPPLHRPRAAPAVRREASGDPDHPSVRGARLRDPADLHAVGRRRGAVPPGPGLPGRARRPRDPRPDEDGASRSGACLRAAAERPRDDRRSAHVRAPRRPVARHLRRGALGDSFGGAGMSAGLRFAFFGSSLVSSYWNGACTYYRGIIRSLHSRGHPPRFYEPHAYDRQEHRDIPDPDWAQVVIYEPDDVLAMVRRARGADVVVKTSGVGVNDELLEAAVVELEGPQLKVFWDVDAPATLARVEGDRADPFRELIPEYDLVLTYGGGDPVVSRYTALGARACIPVYNALDPATHHPVPGEPRFEADLSFL